MKARSIAAALAILVPQLVACGSVDTSAQSPAGAGAASPAGTVAPDFTGRDLQGKTFRLSDHLGKDVILLDFWSTYCEPCKAEFPHLADLYAKDKDKGLLVLGVAMDGINDLAIVAQPPGYTIPAGLCP